MSSGQGRKPNAEGYEYSWFLPAGGHNGSAVAHVTSFEAEAAARKAENSEVEAMEAQTERWRHSGEKNGTPQSKSLGPNQAGVRIIGMVGWSAVAGSGAILLISRAGQFPSLQVGILAAVWLGVSTAIWFVPGILSRVKADKA